MGIFGDGGQRGRAAAKGYNFAAHECLQELCDKCHAAWAKVEVITSTGSVFFCQHHHKQYRHSVIAAGHQIRAVLGQSIGGHGAGELGAEGYAGLPEHLPQVVVDGGGAEEQLRGDVPVALALADQPGDLRFLRRELVLGRGVRWRARSPVASSSTRARSANAPAPIEVNISCAVRSCWRASRRRRWRRSHSPYTRWARASWGLARHCPRCPMASLVEGLGVGVAGEQRPGPGEQP